MNSTTRVFQFRRVRDRSDVAQDTNCARDSNIFQRKYRRIKIDNQNGKQFVQVRRRLDKEKRIGEVNDGNDRMVLKVLFGEQLSMIIGLSSAQFREESAVCVDPRRIFRLQRRDRRILARASLRSSYYLCEGYTYIIQCTQ